MNVQKDCPKLAKCKTREQLIRYAEERGAEVKEGGSHTLVRNAKGYTAIPRHKGDLATGTRFSIVKAFVAMGLTILFIAILLLAAQGRVL